jgi:hypothetical protein
MRSVWPLKAAGNGLECIAEVGADRSHNCDGHDRNQRGNQAVFDCCDTGLVSQKVRKKREHGVSFVLGTIVHRVKRRLNDRKRRADGLRFRPTETSRAHRRQVARMGSARPKAGL